MPVVPPPKTKVPPKQAPTPAAAEKPPWVKEVTDENPHPIRRIKTPPPSTVKKEPVEVPWRKPQLKKANPDPPLLPEPVKKEDKPEWATKKRGSIDKQKSIDKPPKEKVEKAIPIKLESKSTKKSEASATAQSKPQDTKTTMQNGKPPPAPPPPPPPPSGGGPPPPPPPPPGKPPIAPNRTPEQQAKIDALRSHPKRRPDPYQLMKEIQKGKKLNHVQTNDRSKPILPRMKSLGKFVFESEAKPASKADAVHNKLLEQIQHGVRLKKVQTNDRSKPVIGGLRKFRRQETLEGKGGDLEQANSRSSPAPLIPIGLSDDVDDIDVLRDDLQSAKQLLDLELQSKVELGKVNQELQCHIITLEAEIDKMKAQLGIIPEDQVAAICRRNSRAFKDIRKSRSGLYRSSSGIKKSKSGVGDKGAQPQQNDLEEDSAMEEVSELQEEITALKGLVQIARKSAEDWEAKYKEASQKLLVAQGNLEDSEQKRILLEKKLEIAQRRRGVSATPTLEKSTQTEELLPPPDHQRRTSKQMAKGTSFQLDSGSEGEEEDVEVDEATILKQKQEREIKLWENKLKSIKDKQGSSRTERKNLKAQQKQMEQDLKDAKVKHKQLQKEVDKMSKELKESMADSDEEAEEEEEESEEESEEEESEEESEESEEEEEEPEESSSEEDDSDEEHDERINVFTGRVKRHENILNALKKGNYLLKANIDRLMDDLEDVKIKHLELEHELNTILNAC